MSGQRPDEREALVQQLVRHLDAQEARANGGYVSLDEVARLCDAATLQWALAADVLLVDYRTGLDPEPGTPRPLTLCRLNRHHQVVKRLTAW